MILVDTSVWVDHLRYNNARLKRLLLDQQVLCHRFIVGELACGSLQRRSGILADLKALPEAHLVEHDEVLSFLDVNRLFGLGIGWVDAHLLASTLLSGCVIWTLDKALRRAATVLNILA